MSPPLLKRDLSEDSEAEVGGNPKKLATEARPAPTTTIASTTIVDSKDSMSSELPPSATPSPARPSWDGNGPPMGSAAGAQDIPEGADFAVVISPRREGIVVPSRWVSGGGGGGGGGDGSPQLTDSPTMQNREGICLRLQSLNLR